MRLDDEARYQASRQKLVAVAKAKRVRGPLRRQRRACGQGFRNEVVLFAITGQGEAQAHLLVLHHVEDEFVARFRIFFVVQPAV